LRETGIVRKIDSLGRIVIPKEVRRTLRIMEGTPLEIFVEKGGEIVLKKYSPVSWLESLVKEYADSLAKTSGHIVCVADKSEIIAVSGNKEEGFTEKYISSALEEAITAGTVLISDRTRENFVPILEEEYDNANKDLYASLYSAEIIVPIVSEEEILGAVVFLSSQKKMGEIEEKLAQVGAEFLGRQMAV